MSPILRNGFVHLLARTDGIKILPSYKSYMFQTQRGNVNYHRNGSRDYFPPVIGKRLKHKFMFTGSPGLKMSSTSGGISFRRAVMADKEAVLSLGKTIPYGDYLFGSFSDVVDHQDHYPIVAIENNKVVGFCMTTLFDGGVTIMQRTGRVADSHRGRGLFRMMREELSKHTAQHRPDLLHEGFASSNKEDYLLSHFLSNGFKPIYRREIIYKSLDESVSRPPKNDELSVYSTTPDIHEKAPPSAHITMLDIHKKAPPSAHTMMPDVHEKTPPSAHTMMPVVHEKAPPSAHTMMPDVHKKTPPSAHTMMPDVHEKAPPSAHTMMPDVHEKTPPSAHTMMPVVHEKAPPSAHTMMPDVHEKTPPSAHTTMPDVHGKTPPSAHITMPDVDEKTPPSAYSTMPNIHEMSAKDLSVLFQAETSKARVFPKGRLFNFFVSYRLLDENIPALLGERAGAFYSMDTELVSGHDNVNQNQTTIQISQNSSADSKNHRNQFLETDTSRVTEICRNTLTPNDAHQVSMVTFYVSVLTHIGYLYFLDVYAAPQLSTSRNHLTRHLQRHLVTARFQFPNKNGVLALTFDPHLSKDMIVSCLDELGINKTIPSSESSVLYEKSIRTGQI